MGCAALRDPEIRLRTDVEQHEKKAGIAFINFATLFRDADGIGKRRQAHRRIDTIDSSHGSAMHRHRHNRGRAIKSGV
jgi:hypothetical protein